MPPAGGQKTMIAGWARIVSGDSPQKNCPGYSQDSETSIIIGEAVASPQLSLYKRRIFVYNRENCNEDIIESLCEKFNSVI